jgi:hypothetical protein
MLARFSGPTDDAPLRAVVPAVAFLNHVGLRLVGGLRLGQGTRFFPFAKPSVSVEGGAGTEKVLLDGEPLERIAPALYALPEGAPVDRRLVLTLQVAGDEVRRQSVRLVGDTDWTHDSGIRVDAFGDSLEDGPGFAGAYSDPPLVEGAGRFRPTVSLPALNKAVLVGRLPGQVCEWPHDPVPEWEPIWAIGPSLRGRHHHPVIFCGVDPDDALPLRPERSTDRRSLRRWRHELWGMRKRNDPPRAPIIARLWDAYLEAARR